MADDEEIDPLKAALLASYSRTPETPQHIDERLFAEISAADYVKFLTPEDMLAAMPYGVTVNQIQLGRELRAERYKSAADEVHWSYGGFVGRDKLAVLPSWVWSVAMPEALSDFWRTGYMEAYIPKGDGGYFIPDSSSFLRIYGARFSACSVELPVALHKADEAQKSNVAQSELARWHELFAALHPAASEALALRSAAAMFPDNNVPRQWVRDLRGPQPLGKPKGRHK